ncbi:hypothetical protein TIFTF001_033685 [Ficus carica]|uniref:AB hydrolase-1 domain-containing protein n=1 Tax=Ficus carica TaxID=3494 RepID=A0AA88DZ56_FICCA|nr:hypothetical protein TIFTF001_033685 [Ficus carica]
MFIKRIALVLFIVLLSWAYQAARPPPPKIYGSPGGPLITAPRIRLRDGRHLAYKEYGVPREGAKYKIIFVHSFSSCRHDAFVATNTLSNQAMEKVTPDPSRTMKSLALDIEELADQLGLGTKFYVIGYSMGGQVIWGCLKYIPNRLEDEQIGLKCWDFLHLGMVKGYWILACRSWTNCSSDQLLVDVFPGKLVQQPRQDQWTLRVAHYIPWLTYWWNTQRLFPASSVIARSPHVYSLKEFEIITKLLSVSDPEKMKIKV